MQERQPARPEHDFRFSPRPNRAAEIGWLPWSEGAFRQAQNENKPILLSISAVWCHWCHVMDETSYSDPGAIEAINRLFVPIRVDSDRYPDVNRRYNQGGWPTTAFLTPSGDLMTGGTYIPPERFRNVLRQVHAYYQGSHPELQATSAQWWTQATELTPAHPGVLDEGIGHAVAADLRHRFDALHGGFGTDPKFPQLDALGFALERYFHTADSALGHIARFTLDRMQDGAIHDQVAGGFFRYATRRDWSTPHFEKLLADNAGFLRLYATAYRVFGDSRYRDTALGVSRYLNDTLFDSRHGVFFGSQDADEDYYALDGAGRLRRPAPYVDRTVYVDANAEMASAFATAYRWLEDAGKRQTALRIVDFLWASCFRPGLGVHHYWVDGQPHRPGLLGDQAAMLLALLDAYEVSGNPDYLDQAEELAHIVRTRFAAPTGGFYDQAQDGAQFGLLRLADRTLSDNAKMAEAHRRLGMLAASETYTAIAEQTLRAFAGDANRLGLSAADYALAVEHQLRAPLHVVIVGDRRDARTADLFWAGLELFVPGGAVQLVETHSPRLAALGYPPAPAPVAYVCMNYTCLPPIADAAEIEPAVRQGSC